MKPRIILLEDDDAMRKGISMLLKRSGYEVLSASDPGLCPIYPSENAHCDHKDSCGDFLLTDNQMPNMTGLEFIEAQNRRGCKGVIRNKAVMSGSWTQEDQEKAKQLGCKIFHKPFDFEELLDWLEERKSSIPADRTLVDFTDKLVTD